MRGCGAIILDANGNRFVDELGTRDHVSGEIRKNKGPYRLVINYQASEEIAWHIKHYVGRFLMVKFNNGNELAKEIGCTADHLAGTFKKYKEDASKKSDPYGKRFFHNTDF